MEDVARQHYGQDEKIIKVLASDGSNISRFQRASEDVMLKDVSPYETAPLLLRRSNTDVKRTPKDLLFRSADNPPAQNNL